MYALQFVFERLNFMFDVTETRHHNTWTQTHGIVGLVVLNL